MADGERSWREEAQRHSAVQDEVLMTAFTIVPGFPAAGIVKALAPGVGIFWLMMIAFAIGGIALGGLRLFQAKRRPG